MVLAWVLTE